MYIDNKYNHQIKIWLFLNFILLSIMIMLGGLTRLTDSGLSITEWELFKGFFPPLTDSDWNIYFNLYKEIPEYKLQNYMMSINEFKIIFWWEWMHRFLGRIIGLFFLLPMIYFYIKIGFHKSKNFFFIFILICFQGFVGWYMVSSGLVERVDVSHFRLSIHLVLAFIILSLIYWNFLKYCNTSSFNLKLSIIYPITLILLIFLQISIGAFVAGMDAGQLYNSWPLMGSSYFPDDNEIINIFNISAFSEPSLVQFMHRNLAYLILIIYLFILIKIYKNKLFKLYHAINIFGFILLIQILLGILTLLYGAQILLASMHQISSIFLVSSSVYFLYKNSNLQVSN